MREMVRRFLRQKFGSTGTVLTLLLLALLACLPLNGGQGFGSIDTVAVLVLAGGCVSRDAASGALQMILSRPIRRTEYLAGRYAGILAVFALFLVCAIAIAAAANAVLIRLQIGTDPHGFPFGPAGMAAGRAFFAGSLLAAALLFFSTFLRGFGDVLAVILSTILLGSAQNLGRLLNKPLLAKIGQIVQENSAPSVPWEDVLRGRQVLGEATGRYVLALALYWTLAALVFCRREFSYGQE